jgi:hypothetical protein
MEHPLVSNGMNKFIQRYSPKQTSLSFTSVIGVAHRKADKDRLVVAPSCKGWLLRLTIYIASSCKPLSSSPGSQQTKTTEQLPIGFYIAVSYRVNQERRLRTLTILRNIPCTSAVSDQ